MQQVARVLDAREVEKLLFDYVSRLLAMQVTILYRYLFLVVDEFERRKRAAAARTGGRA